MGDMLPRKKSANKIFVGGLHWETTDEKLRKHFTIFGEVTDAVVMKDPVSRRSRGFGFITFADAISVDRVLAQDNHILDSRRVEAKRAVPRCETLKDPGPPTPPSRPMNLGNAALPGLLSNAAHQFLAPLPPPYPPHQGLPAANKIFVGGLHYETKDAEFRQYFENFGRVVSAEVMFNRETHKSRGFGFVVFEDEASVDNVLQTAQHSIDGKMVEVKRAIPRNQVASPVAGGRGLSPSFMGLGGGKGLLGHHLGGPTPLTLEKAMRGPNPNASYASVLRRGGGRPGMDGDLQGLTDGVGGLSLRNKQDALNLQGLGPQDWGTINQLLGDMDAGYHHHHHHHHHHIVRDAHAMLSQQHAQFFHQDPQQAAFLHAGLQQLGLDDFSLAHQHLQQPSAQPPGPPPSGQQSRQTPTEMLASSRPPTSQPLALPPSTTSTSSGMVDMYPNAGLASSLMSEPPSASSSRYPFASAGQMAMNGPGPASANNMGLWAGAPFDGDHHLMGPDGQPSQGPPPPGQHPNSSAPPPASEQQRQQWETMMLYNAARNEAAASALNNAPPTAGMPDMGPEYGGVPNSFGLYGSALSIDQQARMMAHQQYMGTSAGNTHAEAGGTGGGAGGSGNGAGEIA